MTVAYLTGWRIKSEVLPIQWSRVDMNAGSVRLDPGTTKNDDGRVFPFTKFPELADTITRQREYTSAVERQKGTIIPWVFHRNGVPIKDFRGAWKSACEAAGVAGRIPHDFRRTAVRTLSELGCLVR